MTEINNTDLYKALGSFQSQCPPIGKDKKGHGYKYAPMEAILTIINPILNKNGLTFTQPMRVNDSGQSIISTQLIHMKSGASITSDMVLSPDFDPVISASGKQTMTWPQKKGCEITYFRRYMLCAILGIIPEAEDSDAVIASKAPPPPPPPPVEDATEPPPAVHNVSDTPAPPESDEGSVATPLWDKVWIFAEAQFDNLEEGVRGDAMARLNKRLGEEGFPHEGDLTTEQGRTACKIAKDVFKIMNSN